jgi:hypothetical protein
MKGQHVTSLEQYASLQTKTGCSDSEILGQILFSMQIIITPYDTDNIYECH